MNILEIHVSNITSEYVRTMYHEDGTPFKAYRLTADRNCYGAVEEQTTFTVLENDYRSIMENGFYLG